MPEAAGGLCQPGPARGERQLGTVGSQPWERRLRRPTAGGVLGTGIVGMGSRSELARADISRNGSKSKVEKEEEADIMY